MLMTKHKMWMGVFAALSILVGSSLVVHAVETHRVSQKGRKFQPAEIGIAKGDTLLVGNDDGELLHHLFIQSDAFSFDSGQQEPGKVVTITFPKAGTFDVLCGIHPRMRLSVNVK